MDFLFSSNDNLYTCELDPIKACLLKNLMVYIILGPVNYGPKSKSCLSSISKLSFIGIQLGLLTLSMAAFVL